MVPEQVRAWLRLRCNAHVVVATGCEGQWLLLVVGKTWNLSNLLM